MKVVDQTYDGLMKLSDLKPGEPFRVPSTGFAYVRLKPERPDTPIPCVAVDSWALTSFTAALEVRRLVGTLTLENG